MTSFAESYPFDGLMPKQETESLSFLTKYPENDGRGVTVAILDTGVDPGAAGLQATSDGKVKIVDIIDCNGSGDVLFGEDSKVKLTFDSVTKTWPPLTGKSGRSLTLDNSLVNPTGEFYLSMKRGFDFFPKPLVSRLKNEHAKDLAVIEASLQESVQGELQALKDEKDVEKKSELLARRDVLKDVIKEYEYLGPLFDVIVFHDGSDWRAIVDTSEKGELSSSLPMADYAKYHEFGQISKVDKLNYSFKFYGFIDATPSSSTGRVLSIVTNSGSHGTHVASIVSAYFPDKPELNGVAPGCQIVSLKIGETRLGSMETGQALTRAFLEIVRLKCDLVNISYGEAPNIPNFGQFVNHLKELALKHNVTVVSSAGNGGPALSTVGCPGGTSSYAIGIGAYVTPAMMKSEYAMLESVTAMPYTWTSQPPTYDGDIGVHIYAPGGAITSVPNWTLQPNQLMNGTSMSSPNACGCLALLYSAAKSNGLKISPFRTKRAIMNSARSIDQDPFKRGLLQVEKSLSYLKQFSSFVDNDVFFEVSTSSDGDRGIYIRDFERCSKVQTFANVQVQPKFQETVDNEVKVKFELHLALVPSESWIKCPNFLQLNHGGRGFSVQVDPTSLPSGLHVGYIHAFDTNCPERGPIFEVPVTVCKPEEVNSSVGNGKVVKPSLRLRSGEMQRFFFQVPEWACSVSVSVTPDSLDSPGRFVFHSNQIVMDKRYSRTENQFYFTFGQVDGDIFEKIISLEPGVPLEVCLCPFWATRGHSSLSLSLEFEGIVPSPRQIVLAPGTSTNFNTGYLRIPVSSSRNVGAKPSISLSHLVRFIRADESDSSLVSPLIRERDALPNGQVILQVVLSYSFSIGSSNASVKPCFSTFGNHLYDSPLDSFLYQVFDQNKKLISFGDVYGSSVSLSPGDYVLKLQLRHQSSSVLESLSSSVALLLEVPLGKDISVPLYRKLSNLLEAGDKITKPIAFSRGEVKNLFVPLVNVLSSDEEGKLVGDLKANPGDFLRGTLSFSNASKKDGDASKEKSFAFPVSLSLSGLRKPNPLKEIPAVSATEAKTPERLLHESVRDARIKSLNAENVEKEDSQIWSQWYSIEYKDDIVFKIALLRKLDKITFNEVLLVANGKAIETKVVNYSKVKDLVHSIRSNIDQTSLAQYLGTVIPSSSPSPSVKWTAEQELEKNDQMQRRDILVESSLRYLKALYVENAGTTEEWKSEIQELRKWTDLTANDEAFIIQFIEHIVNGRFGTCLKELRKKKPDTGKSSAESPLKLTERQINSARLHLLNRLNWKHYEDWLQLKTLGDFPSQYASF